MKESLEFYNKFDKKLINDYVLGNIRIVCAIKKLVQFIPNASKNILDIGCGLGWSSHEFAKAFPDAQVEGIDLSPVLIETASKLFDQPNLDYKCYDLTQGLPEQKYDAILMIDVYEHIPCNDRAEFHKSIKQRLNDQGCLILACPSKYHQAYLKNNNPEGLQPVDEDVDFNTIQQVAKVINGEVVFFEYQSIWNEYDYLYAIIEIKPIYTKIDSNLTGISIDLETKPEREHRVLERLGIEIPKAQVEKKKPSLKRFLKRVKKKLKQYRP